MLKVFIIVTLFALSARAEKSDETIFLENGTYQGNIQVDGHVSLKSTLGNKMSIASNRAQIELNYVDFFTHPFKRVQGNKILRLTTNEGTFNFAIPRTAYEGNISVPAEQTAQGVALRVELESEIIERKQENRKYMCSKVCSIGENSFCPGVRTAVIEIFNTSERLKVYFISPSGTIVFLGSEKSRSREFELSSGACRIGLSALEAESDLKNIP